MYDLKNSFQWLNDQKQTMLELLLKLAKQNSGTKNTRGVEQVAKIVKDELLALGSDIITRTLPGYVDVNLQGIEENIGVYDFISATKRAKADRKLLLGGHLDTVYEKNLTEVKKSGEYLIGPGVADMKGGIVVMLFALQAYERLDTDNKIGWEVFLSCDEETGSLASANELAKLSKKYKLGFIFEPSVNLHGDISGNRMGSGKFSIIVRGKSAHVGRDFTKGKNAIVYLAAIIQEIHRWNTKRKDIIINIGKISGGDVVNKIPDFAITKIDVRVSSSEAADWFSNKCSTFVESLDGSDGYQVKIVGKFTRPAKILTDDAKRVLARLQQVAKSINQDINILDTGGCCDGNNLAEHGCVAIDTLGVVGENIHSPKERMLIESLVYRSQLTLSLMLDYQHGNLL